MISTAYKQHGFWSVLEEVENRCRDFSESSQADERYLDICEKFEYIRWMFETNNPSFVSEGEMQSATQLLKDISNHLPNDAGGWGHYTHIANQFAALLQRFPYPRIKKIFRSEANDAIQETVGKTAELSRSIDEASAELQETQSALGEEIQSVESRLQVLNDRISEEQAMIETRIASWETDFNSKASQKLTEFAEAFSDTQMSRKEEFQETFQSVQKQIARMNTAAEEVAALNKRQRDEASEALALHEKNLSAKAEDIVERLNKLYQQAGQDVLASDFAGNSASEGKQFVLYSVFAALAFLIAAGVLGQIWWSLSGEEDFQIISLFMRLPISLVFLIPGFYFSSLAKEHRNSSTKLRSLGLRIKAFDAYLVNSSVENPEALKSEMAKEFFVEEKDQWRTAKGLFSSPLDKRFDRLVNIAEKLVDKVPGEKP